MKKIVFYIFLAMLTVYTIQAQMTVKDASANVLMTVNDEGSEGSITLPAGSAAPSTTTNKLYNVTGDLYWDGTKMPDGHSLDAADGSPTDVVYVDNSGNVGVGTTSPGTLLHVRISSTGYTAPLCVEQTGTSGDASVEYYLNGSGSQIFSSGVDAADKRFKITNAATLTAGAGSAQSDGRTMLQVQSTGILDINNQSRARAFITVPQLIPPGVWTAVSFDTDTPLPNAFDEQNEFATVAAGSGLAAQFVASVTGYYQVNARTAFDWTEVGQMVAGGYVSIAIFVNGVMAAQGNNLQMVVSPTELLLNNNAPNVSDVVFLTAADVLEIHVFQNVDILPIFIKIGFSQTYVSIHKVS
ncbi:hypothetical protein JW948_11755 [bacterium]|nr:hypothetical protein [bacterium]